MKKDALDCTLFGIAIVGIFFTIIAIPLIFNLSKKVEIKPKTDVDSLQVIVVQKDSTIRQLKLEMTDEVDKALNATDSDAIKQFINLCTK